MSEVETNSLNAGEQSGIDHSEAGASDIFANADSLNKAIDNRRADHRPDDRQRDWEPRAADREAMESRKALRDTLEKNVGGVLEDQNAVNTAWTQSEEDRNWFVRRFPGKEKEMQKIALDFGPAFQKDPAAAGNALARYWLSQHKNWEMDKAPVPKDRKSIRDSFEWADRDLQQRNDFDALLKHYGPQIAVALKQFRGLVSEMDKDPIGTAGRVAASHNMPVMPDHQAEVAAAAHHERLVEGVGRVIESGKLPGFEILEVQNLVADILEDPRFPNSGDPGVNLKTAYEYAIPIYIRNETARARSAAKKAASMSITGGPSASTVAHQRASAGAPSIRQALERQVIGR